MTAQMGILSLVRLVCEYSLSCTLFSKWRLWNTCMLHVSLNVKLILNQPSVKRHFRICISQRSHVPGHPPYTTTISSFFPKILNLALSFLVHVILWVFISLQLLLYFWFWLRDDYKIAFYVPLVWLSLHLESIRTDVTVKIRPEWWPKVEKS